MNRHFTYDTSLGGLQSITDVTSNSPVLQYVLDANGQVTSRTHNGSTVNFTWDADGRLVSAATPGPTSQLTASYVYDGLGMRRRAEVKLTPPTGPPSTTTRSWNWAGADGEEEVDENGRTTSSVGPFRLGEGTSRFGHDALGSVTSQNDGFGAQFAEFSSWGQLNAIGTLQSSAGFAGGRVEAALGLNYNRRRWEDPISGVFLSRDEVGAGNYLTAPNGLGPWNYAALSPGRFVDPDGRVGLQDDYRWAERYGRASAEVVRTAREGDKVSQALVATYAAIGGAYVVATAALVCTTNPVGLFVCRAIGAKLLAGTFTSEVPTQVAIASQINSCREFDERYAECGFNIGGAAMGGGLIARDVGPALMSGLRDPIAFEPLFQASLEGAVNELSGEDIATLFGQRELTFKEEALRARLLANVSRSRQGNASSRFGEYLDTVRARQLNERPIVPTDTKFADISQRITVERRGAGAELRWGNVDDERGIIATVGGGQVVIDVRALNSQIIGGRDMVLSVLRRIDQENIAVHTLKGVWLDDTGSVNAAEFRLNMAMPEATELNSAADTWTGRLFKSIGWEPKNVLSENPRMTEVDFERAP